MTLQSIRVPFTSVYQLKEERKTEEENNIFFNTDPLARKVRLSKMVLISRSICVLEMIVERTWREKVDVWYLRLILFRCFWENENLHHWN